MQAQVDALVDGRIEEYSHLGPSAVHRRGAIRELQERLYPQRGIHLMSTAESYTVIEQHQKIGSPFKRRRARRVLVIMLYSAINSEFSLYSPSIKTSPISGI